MDVSFATNRPTLIIAENYMQTRMSAEIKMWVFFFLIVCFQPDIVLKTTDYK